MRKNTARHWLHAALDLLPVLLIPVFMIYSHRHTISDSSIQVQEKISVNFNQLRGDFVDSSFNEYGVLVSTNGEGFVLNGINTGTGGRLSYYNSLLPRNFNITKGHKYYVQTYRTGTQNLLLYINNSSTNQAVYGGYYYNAFFTAGQSFNANIGFNFGNLNMVFEDYIVRVNIYDLTQMNLEDVTEEEFSSYFPNQYYPFVQSQKMLVNKPTLTTYADSDILSQFTYQMYNAVDKYFNMGNVFGMNNVYYWFELNIFGGSAPLYIYIVWNIVLYEFVMDLLFLLYGLFMFFIDMCKRLMEKPLDSIK